MNNTTDEICQDHHRYDSTVHVTFFLWHALGLTAIIVGIPGNLFQVTIVSRRIHRTDATAFYFIAIAICELIFLIGLFWLWCVNMSLTQIDPRQVLSCGLFYSIFTGSTSLSNVYLAFLSIDRSFIILRPIDYRVRITRCHVLLRIVFAFVLISLFLVPHHYYFYYDPRSTLFLCEFQPSINRERVRLWSFIHAIVFVSIPSLIVCISAFILLHNRCKHRRLQQRNPSEAAKRMQKLSILIFLFSLGAFLSIVPAGILKTFLIHDRLYADTTECSIRWKIYKILLHSFLILSSINYSAKFYIHLTISTAFREEFLLFIRCRTSRNKTLLVEQRIDHDDAKSTPLLITENQQIPKHK